ncbi:MAG: N-acetyl-gamma-glutamyl-phosphate reductase [Anaerolineae bacterium]|nr:N-acetyl-gamma-glutamyl-phosphate reductase [Anaerolineae bacterium]
MTTASIVGGSGYAGGELLRLLLGHPQIEVTQITSRQYAGKFVYSTHPNLRGSTRLKFTTVDELAPCDVLFLALPHGEASTQIERFSGLAGRIIDLSADFRLKDLDLYREWYGLDHPAPEWLSRFVYGLPELHRADLQNAKYASGVGCNATAVNLALWPLATRNLIDHAVVEVKVGSSEGGNAFSLATHHPERSGCVRSFAPTGHRHQAEMLQELGAFDLYFSATAIELVRGVLCTAHVFLKDDLAEKDVWGIYREAYGSERFVRLVKDRQGVYRYPEPKLLAGTNYCDVGFEKDPRSNRLVVISAIDNLMKGAAGSAVQSMNVMMGWPEDEGLGFMGLHPV